MRRHAERGHLQHEMQRARRRAVRLAVGVDHESGEKVAFGMHETEDRRAFGQAEDRETEVDRAVEPLHEQRVVERPFMREGDEAHPDLALAVPPPGTDRLALVVAEFDDRTVPGVAFDAIDRARKDPRVTEPKRTRLARLNEDLRHRVTPVKLVGDAHLNSFRGGGPLPFALRL